MKTARVLLFPLLLPINCLASSSSAEPVTIQASASRCDPFVFIFVNPSSGGNQGSMFTRLGVDYFHFTDRDIRSHVYISDIRKAANGSDTGFHQVAKVVKRDSCISELNPARIVVAGGDGTAIWAITECKNRDIDLDKLAFAIVPLGTGNDLSRVLGWGATNPRSLFNYEMRRFKTLLREWLRADTLEFDLWRVSMRVSESTGYIARWLDGVEVILKDEEEKKVLLRTSKLMSNYFSLGIESMVGMAFDRNRMKSQIGNKLMYGFLGIMHMLRASEPIQELVNKCSTGKNSRNTLFSADGNSKLAGNPKSLIFLNINSFAGGCDLWSGASNGGIVGIGRQVFGPQSVKDGKLEVISYASLMDLGLEQAIRMFPKGMKKGRGMRVGQRAGPFKLDFNPLKQVYTQIDGEFYLLNHPEAIEIELETRTKVMRRKASTNYL